MEYQEIVNSILSKLTDNKNENIKYLKEQMELYKNHRYGKEIVAELGRKIYDNFNNDDKDAFENAFMNDVNNLNLMLDEAKKLFDEKKYDKVKEILAQYLEAALLVNKETDTVRFFSFRNTLEFFYAIEKIKIDKKMVWTVFEFSWAYNILSYIANEEGDYVKARELCDKAIYYNPLDVKLYFEKTTSYQLEKDYENMRKTTQEAYEYIFNHIDLSQYYRRLGFYYTEINKLDVAFALYLVSLHFDVTDYAYNEIEYIKLKLKDPNYMLTTDRILELLKKENIPFGIKSNNKVIIDLIDKKNDITLNQEDYDSLKNEREIMDKEMEPVEELLNGGEIKKEKNILFDYSKDGVEMVINNEYDYSNAIITEKYIDYLVKYCDQVYNNFCNLMEEDKQKNSKLKYGFQNYNYKKKYSEAFEIRIREKNHNNIVCKNYNSFIDVVNNGKLKNIYSLKISLHIDFRRGTNDNLKDHDNSFEITFEPYNIKFLKKSNYNDFNMNQIENNINEILKKIPVVNTIFCSK